MCQFSTPESVHGPERAGPLSPTALLASSVKATVMRKGGHQNLMQLRCPTGAFVLSVTTRRPKESERKCYTLRGLQATQT